MKNIMRLKGKGIENVDFETPFMVSKQYSVVSSVSLLLLTEYYSPITI
jgi:hypothetical protein